MSSGAQHDRACGQRHPEAAGRADAHANAMPASTKAWLTVTWNNSAYRFAILLDLFLSALESAMYDRA